MFKSIRDVKEETRVLNERNNEYLSIFKPTKVIGKLQIDEVNELFKVMGILNPILKYDELIEYELIQDDESVTSGGLGLGRAVVGGVLAGGIGILLGGLTKDRKTKTYINDLHFKIKYRFDDELQSVDLIFIKNKTNQKSSAYRRELKNVEKVIRELDNIIGEDEEVTSMNPADELMKYKELLDMGAIDRVEYDEVKSRLLS